MKSTLPLMLSASESVNALLYRFGFADDTEHPLTETAERFFGEQSRSHGEPGIDNVRLELTS